MSRVLISYHTFSGKTKALAEAAAEGAKNAGAEILHGQGRRLGDGQRL